MVREHENEADEQDRLAALYQYHILDTAEEQDFDELAELASAICGTPIALISLVDEHRQWFKAHKGVPFTETERESSFCAQAIKKPDDILIVENAATHPFFATNRLVTGPENIVFYAGVPLVNEDGFALGSLCVIDHKEHRLSEHQRSALKIIARQVMDKLELRRKVGELETANISLRKSRQEVDQLNHNLKVDGGRMISLIRQTPVPTIVFRGDRLRIDAVNDAMLELLGQQGDIVGKDLLQAIPELEGQDAYEILVNVYKTGKPYNGYDTPVQLMRNGAVETGYFNFSYVPLIEDGRITGVIDVAYNVTAQYIANQETLRSERLLQQAINSAKIGIWSIDIRNRHFIASERFRYIYELDEQQPVSARVALGKTHPAFRRQMMQLMSNAIASEEGFIYEYPILSSGENGHDRWVRASGTLFCDIFGEPAELSGTIVDITEEKLDERRKDDFISMVSHELKTPLTALKGYLQITGALLTGDNDPFASAAISKGNIITDKMTRIISDFLDVSRFESGNIHLNIEQCNLTEMIRHVIEDYQVLHNNSHSIEFNCAATVTITADCNKIQQVVENLVSNAIKYSPTGSLIQISCSSGNDVAHFAISNEGPGIAPADQEKLFRRFYRANQNSNVSGFGIGLYLCTEIVSSHGGKIWVESEPGKGATFRVELPEQATFR